MLDVFTIHMSMTSAAMFTMSSASKGSNHAAQPVLQAIILLLGGVVSVIAVVVRVPGHGGTVISEAHQEHKLSLGQAGWSWQQRTVPTVLAYSAVHYLTKFITFQDAVQRYLAVPSHKVGITVVHAILGSDAIWYKF